MALVHTMNEHVNKPTNLHLLSKLVQLIFTRKRGRTVATPFKLAEIYLSSFRLKTFYFNLASGIINRFHLFIIWLDNDFVIFTSNNAVVNS
jgi:hypothetical protein